MPEEDYFIHYIDYTNVISIPCMYIVRLTGRHRVVVDRVVHIYILLIQYIYFVYYIVQLLVGTRWEGTTPEKECG
jgi:hypothetical protein